MVVAIVLTPVPVLAEARGRDERMNVVVIVADDMRADSLEAMPISGRLLASRGTTFTSAYATTPWCCPFRATLLSGGHGPMETGVDSNGAARRFQDGDTLATRLRDRGYETAMIGKYLNAYGSIAPRVPPGWSRWMANLHPLDPDWFDYEMVEGSSGGGAGRGRRRTVRNTYVTDLHSREATRFVRESARPFFLYLAPLAPHGPASPAPDDRGRFAGFRFTGGAYGERDLEDKAPPVRAASRTMPRGGLAFPAKQLESLQALDRAVGRVVAEVERSGELDRTVFVFTSDNGLLWGEHGLRGKGHPFEESVRVPLVVVGPGIAAGRDDRLVAAAEDVGATVLDAAGARPGGAGRSLLAPAATDPRPGTRRSLVLQSFDWRQRAGGKVWGVWAAIVRVEGARRWKYVEWADGGAELYDLVRDPHEMESLLAGPDRGARAQSDDLARELHGTMALSWATVRLPVVATCGPLPRLRLRASGGSGSYRFRPARALPTGFRIEGDSLVATRPLIRPLSIALAVEDAMAPDTYAGLRASHEQVFDLPVRRCREGLGRALASMAAGAAVAGAAALAAASMARRSSGGRDASDT